eukprot:6601713-Karenia_brevis.AAC.1
MGNQLSLFLVFWGVSSPTGGVGHASPGLFATQFGPSPNATADHASPLLNDHSLFSKVLEHCGLATAGHATPSQ